MNSLVFLGSLWGMSSILVFSGVILLGCLWGVEFVFSSESNYFLETSMVLNIVLMSLVLVVIYSMVLVFSSMYMVFDKLDWAFIFVVFIFVLGMLIFLMMSDWYSVLIGWEVLGVVSFVLIYYYSNNSSKISSLFTIMINRLGDLGFVVYLSLLLSGIMGFDWCGWEGFILIICLLSKSAQYPFSVWLPMAMSAPTPVSALVHSSTLVTAGVFVVVFSILEFSGMVLNLIFWFGVFTVGIAGFSSLVEKDVKKVVALSTLFHLGVLGVLVSVSVTLVVYFHLFFHGFFKSLLFVTLGLIILSLFHNQDLRVMTELVSYSKIYVGFMVFSVFSLIGVPFFSGAMGKEVFISGVESSGSSLFVVLASMVFLACSFTYSMKLVCGVWSLQLGLSGGFASSLLLFGLMVLLGLVSMAGWFLLDLFVLSSCTNYSSWVSILLFWVLSLCVFWASNSCFFSSCLDMLVNLYKICFDWLMKHIVNVFVDLESLSMSFVLSVIPSGFSSMMTLFVLWFGVFTVFICGLVFIVMFVVLWQYVS